MFSAFSDWRVISRLEFHKSVCHPLSTCPSVASCSCSLKQNVLQCSCKCLVTFSTDEPCRNEAASDRKKPFVTLYICYRSMCLTANMSNNCLKFASLYPDSSYWSSAYLNGWLFNPQQLWFTTLIFFFLMFSVAQIVMWANVGHFWQHSISKASALRIFCNVYEFGLIVQF